MIDRDDTEGLVDKSRKDPRPRIFRFSVAIFGASIITIGLLLFMQDLVSRLLERDPTQYFSINRFIPAPDRGRQLPDVPIEPADAPDAPKLELVDEEEIVFELPEVVVEPDALPTGQPLNLE